MTPAASYHCLAQLPTYGVFCPRLLLLLPSHQDPVAFLGEVYVSDNVSEAADAWNKWRREVVDYAVNEKIVPALLQELRTHLTATAIETALTQVQDT